VAVRAARERAGPGLTREHLWLRKPIGALLSQNEIDTGYVMARDLPIARNRLIISD